MDSRTEVWKEAGDIILLDNDFASIIEVIETGWLLDDNFKKVAIYLLPVDKLFSFEEDFLFDFFVDSWSQIWPILF